MGSFKYVNVIQLYHSQHHLRIGFLYLDLWVLSQANCRGVFCSFIIFNSFYAHSRFRRIKWSDFFMFLWRGKTHYLSPPPLLVYFGGLCEALYYNPMYFKNFYLSLYCVISLQFLSMVTWWLVILCLRLHCCSRLNEA